LVKLLEKTRENSPSGGAFPGVEWRISDAPVDYAQAVAEMERRVANIRAGNAAECVWLLEHPPVYTAGTSAKPEDLLTPNRFPVMATGRGGQYAYHGPGQRIAYVMLDLSTRGRDVRAYVCALEDWIIETLSFFGVRGERREKRIGVWVARPQIGTGHEDKIAAIGVRVRRWVTFHGLSLNVNPVLEHYSGIVPCGVQNHGVTSLADLGKNISMDEVDSALRKAFTAHFGSAEK
jgi:lipoyl(octanoyl) transferase